MMIVIWASLIISFGAICLPILVGLAGVILPAAGYFPAVGAKAFSDASFAAFFAHPAALNGISHSLFIGLMAGFLSVLFVFAILSCGLQDGMGASVMRWHKRLMGPLIALPHSTIAIAMLFLLAPSGWLIRLISPELTGLTRPPAFGIVPDQTGWLLIIGLMMKEIPFLLFIALAQSQRLPLGRLQHLGQSFGYQPVVVWAYVIWPQIYRQMRLPIMAVLAYSLSVVDMGLILGPNLPPPLAILVLQGFYDADLQARLAASAGAFIQILVIICGVGLWLFGEYIARLLMKLCLAHGARLALLPAMISTSFIMITGAFALLSLGLCAIGLWAFANRWPFGHKWPQDFGLRFWQSEAAFGSVIIDSVLIGFVATISAMLISVFWLEHLAMREKLVRLITVLLFVPLFVPQISLLFGLQVALSWAYLDGLMVSVIFVHMLYILPYMWLILAPAYQGHDGRFMALAQMMGYGPLRVFLAVRLGMLGHSFGSAFIIGVAVSIALYLPSVFAGAGRITTITIEAVTLAASGARGPSAQAAFMQMLLPLAVFIIVRVMLKIRFRRFSAMQAHAQ